MLKLMKIGLLIFVTSITIFSCSTTGLYNKKNPYPKMEIVHYGSSQAYLFPHATSDKLIIVLEGSGWNSVLGIKEKDTWKMVMYGSQLLQELSGDYIFLIPEKLKRQPGKDYSEDMDDRAHYTAENLIACYSESIDGYLAEHVFSSIVMVGLSEGACLLPIVYQGLQNKDKITAMVSIGYGGLSLYDSYSILYSSRTFYTQEWLDMLSTHLKNFNPENNSFPDSFEEDYYGITYRWFKSIAHLRPFDYYKEINIPIWFIHGNSDYRIPGESTAYIQENLPEKPFQYWYYPWAHQPEKDTEIIEFRKDVAEWIRWVSQ